MNVNIFVTFVEEIGKNSEIVLAGVRAASTCSRISRVRTARVRTEFKGGDGVVMNVMNTSEVGIRDLQDF